MGTGTYTIKAANATTGCSAAMSGSTTVSTNPLPTVNAFTNATYCNKENGAGISFSGSATSYTWISTADVGFGTSGTGNINSFTATNTTSAPIIATVTVTPHYTNNNVTCDGSPQSFTITVNPSPTITITPSGLTTFCSGGSVNLAAGGASTYLWSDNETGSLISVNKNGTFSVTGTDANGCMATSSSTLVTVNPLPTVNVNAGGPTTFCSGGSVTLTASGGNTYLWSDNETGTSINVIQSGSYSVTGTDLNGCKATSSGILVTVNPLPTIIISANGPTSLCSGGLVTLSANGGTTYLWSDAESTPSITVSQSGSYSVTGTDNNGCKASSASTLVTVNPLPTVYTVTGGGSYCSGGTGVTITLSGSDAGINYTLLLNGSTIIGTKAGTGSALNFMNVTGAGTYTIQAQNNTTLCSVIMTGSPSVTINPLTSISSQPNSSIKYVAENTSFSVSAGGTGILGYQWQVSTDGGHTFGNITDGAVYAGSGTPTLSLTGVTYAMNGYQYECLVSGGCGNSTSNVATLTVNKRPIKLTYTGGTSVQYSDQVNLSAAFADNSGSSVLTNLSGRIVTFTVGSQSATATTNSSGVASTTLIINQAPNSYAVIVSFDGTSDNRYGSSTNSSSSLTVAQEDARVYYTGSLFASTTGVTSSTANLTLSATVKDITAVPTDPAYDTWPGDIRKASVFFVLKDASTAIVVTSPQLTPGLVSVSDTKVGTVTWTYTANIGSANSVSYTVEIHVGMNNTGYYTRFSTDDNSVVTVSKPLSDFVTGGGFLLLTNSSGIKAGDVGSKSNFGFDVKYNKSGTNLQGHANIIVRRTESDNIQHVYQVMGNHMTSLSVNSKITSTHPYPTAVFDGQAVIQDITDPNLPVSVDGNATLHVTMTDRDNPGSTDGIAITVWNKSGGLWFSSNWNGTMTVEQNLGGGDLKVSTNSSFSSSSTTTATRIEDIASNNEIVQKAYDGKLKVTVMPNPSNYYFTLKLQSGSDMPVNARVVDITGRVIEARPQLPANGVLMIGHTYIPGAYFCELVQGTDRVIVKLIKQPN